MKYRIQRQHTIMIGRLGIIVSSNSIEMVLRNWPLAKQSYPSECYCDLYFPISGPETEMKESAECRLLRPRSWRAVCGVDWLYDTLNLLAPRLCMCKRREIVLANTYCWSAVLLISAYVWSGWNDRSRCVSRSITPIRTIGPIKIST